ncbi:MAG TPA: 16S rRNA (cytosine(1402)-N(4))-methyltransferase RsmH [Nitrospiria bacterium]|nr:16S rRNA (cytosine(1402)-N(4))-methyltransferase RsmH [Nitrospiria bacterium]
MSGVLAAVMHRPVMVTEVLDFLRPREGGRYLDGTVGEGGHAEAILEASSPTGRVIGFDRDPSALAAARERLAVFGPRCQLFQGDYRDCEERLSLIGVATVEGILIDLGVSSYQLDQPRRGFSFRAEGVLDMRFDPSQGRTAAEVIANSSEEELCRWIREYGEERWARRIARSIVRQRQRGPILTTTQLASIVAQAVPPAVRHGRIHPATRTFQALRLVVNGELDGLGEALERLAVRLAPGGRFCVLTYHSLEDRVVKHRFRAMAEASHHGQAADLTVLTRRPHRPSPQEIEANPRARSAKLRVVERTGGQS